MLKKNDRRGAANRGSHPDQATNAPVDAEPRAQYQRGSQSGHHGDRQEHQRIAAGMRDFPKVQAGAQNDDAGLEAEFTDIADLQRGEP
jgi:hypothetical protein